jgi:hypothetical protein
MIHPFAKTGKSQHIDTLNNFQIRLDETFGDSAFCLAPVSSGNAPPDVKSGTKSWRKAGAPGR